MSNYELEATMSPAVSPEDLQAIADKLLRQRQETFENLSRTVESKLQSRMGVRKQKENQWLESLRIYLGSLSSYNLVTGEYPFGTQNDRSLVHAPEHNIVRTKCEAAFSQISAYQFAVGEKNWELLPPQVLDLDDYDIQSMQQLAGQAMDPQQIAEVKADLMSREIDYHLNCSKYGQECRKAMKDWIVLGTGIMKGPSNATKLKKQYVKQQTSDGQIIRVPQFVAEKVPYVYRVNPWYFFPDDTVTEITAAEDSIEVHPMNKTDLRDLMQNPGFFADQIVPVLEEEPRRYLNSPFTDPAYLTQGINLLKNKYMVLEYHGPISKEDLQTLGKTPAIDSPTGEYYGEIWVVNGRCIRLELENIEGCYSIPYCVSTWEPDPATIFGFGIPMLVRDQQRVVNETYKMMLDNAGISAGPQVVVDTTLIKPAEGGLECTPWKVWYTNEFGADTSKAIQFFMPDNAYEGLSALFNQAKALGDEEASVPLLLNGLQQPAGQVDSATAMAVMNENATAPLFARAESWDENITSCLIHMMYDWEMQYNPKEEIKGTYEIDVRTITAQLRSNMNQQKLERLIMMASQQNSPVTEWLNMDAAISAYLTGMHLPYRGIVKTPDQLAKERANRPPPPPDPNMLKAQADLMRAQNEQQRIQIDANQKMIEAQMTYEAQLRTDATREKEAMASVLKAQYDFQSQMAALAQADEQHRDGILTQMQVTVMQEQTKRLVAGIDSAYRAKEQVQKDRELDIKDKIASKPTPAAKKK